MTIKEKPPVILAPMAGYTDRAMRLIAKEMGADLTVTEMVSAKAVTFGDKKTFNLARIRPDEGKVSLQIFGSEPDIMARAALVMSSGFGEGYARPAAIDINMGCPVHKIFSNGEGSALMRDPELIYRIVRAVSQQIDIPCTVKLRAGIDPLHINALDCALAAESAGASSVAIHGRTKTQLYGGKADREIIKNVKEKLHIPVIANGDIVDSASAMAMLLETEADGIMIGRAAVGNPFIFREIKAALQGERVPTVTLSEKKEAAMRQLTVAVEDKGEGIAVRESRKQIAAYFKAFRGSALFRAKINTASTLSEIEEALAVLE